MTEAEWRDAVEPHSLLAYLQESGSVSDRKLRLFAVACVRRVWVWIHPLGQRAVEVAEAFADGAADAGELRAARLACQGLGGDAAWYPAVTNPAIAARNSARSVQTGVAKNPLLGNEAAELLAQAELVREIFGNPFQHIAVDAAWKNPRVLTLARNLYSDRGFERMTELAAALVQVGCAEGALLAHCASPGSHVRGCWALDLLLGQVA